MDERLRGPAVDVSPPNFDDDARIHERDWGFCTARDFFLRTSFTLISCGLLRLSVYLFSQEMLKRARDSNLFSYAANYVMIIDGFSFFVITTCNSRILALCYSIVMLYRAVRFIEDALRGESFDSPEMTFLYFMNILAFGIYFVLAGIFCLIGWTPRPKEVEEDEEEEEEEDDEEDEEKEEEEEEARAGDVSIEDVEMDDDESSVYSDS